MATDQDHPRLGDAMDLLRETMNVARAAGIPAHTFARALRLQLVAYTIAVRLTNEPDHTEGSEHD